MRTGIALALGLLSAVPSCNSIFGVNPTVPFDAPKFETIDALPGHGMLTWWSSTSHPSEDIAFDVIDGATVQIGELDQPLADVAIVGGVFEVNTPPDAMYRLVYQVPGDPIPHEVQWNVRSGFHLTVPHFGRFARTAPSTNYTFNVTNTTSPWPCVGPSPPNPPCMNQGTSLTALTTGAWMIGAAAYRPSQNVLTLSAGALKGIDGTPDALSVTDRDAIMFVHYDVDPTTNPQYQADAYAVVSAFAGATAYPSLAEVLPDGGAPVQSVIFQARSFPTDDAIHQALGGPYLAVGATTVTEVTGGVIPTALMPSMTLSATGGFDGTVLLPLFHTLTPTGACHQTAFPFGTTSSVPGDEFRPPALVYRHYRERPVANSSTSSVVLQSGFQVVSLETQYTTCSAGSVPQLQETVGIAENVKFTMPLASDHTPIQLSHGFQDLTFDLAQGTHADDCEVTPYRIDTSTLVPLRTILVQATPGTTMHVHVPTDDFQSGSQHVFGIVCRDGYPQAAIGDYTAFQGYPQQESQIFPGTFMVTFQ